MLSRVIGRFGKQLGRRWQPGDRLPTVRELASEMNVSSGTVYRALQLMVQSGILMAKPRQGMFVSPQYTEARFRSAFLKNVHTYPEPVHNFLAGKRAVIRFGSTTTHMFPARDAIESALIERGCVILQQHHSQPFDHAQADCLVLINPGPDTHVTTSPDQPLVIVTSAAAGPTIDATHYDCVSIDQHQAAALAGKFLRSAGCQEVCFLGKIHPDTSAYETTSQARLNGFLSSWGNLPEKYRLTTPFYSAIGGAQAAKKYVRFEPRPQGVFTATDELAAGFISGAEALGLRLWRDYHLVGFDGQAQLRDLSPKGVPSVMLPAELMGQYAVDMLLSRWANPSLPSRKLLLGCSLNT